MYSSTTDTEMKTSEKISAENRSVFYLFAKRLLDFFFSFAGIIVLFPLLVGIGISVRITSEGPAIYKQRRVGYKNKVFTIYKFRTMVKDAENLQKYLSREMIEYYTYNRKLSKDPRVTKIGLFLRRTSLDELPQLINVLKGDMSLVGPRPMLEEERQQYGIFFSEYIQMVPGITGLWQVKSRHSTVMNERAKTDREYLNCRGFRTDLKIIGDTVKVVLFRTGR